MSEFFTFIDPLSGSGLPLEVTIAVDSWPVRFQWENRAWRGVDYDSEPVVLGPSTVRELVAKHRIQI